MPHFQKNTALLPLLLAALPALLPGQNSHGQLRQGDRFYDRQDYSRAEQAYRQAEGPLAAYNAGNAALQQNKLDEAAGLFRRAAETAAAPATKSDAWYNLGNVYLKQGKFEEAFAAYQKSLRLQPNFPDAKKNLEIARQKMQRQEPPPPEPPPPPPPPKTPPPRNRYLDQPAQPRQREVPSGGMSPAEVQRLLETVVTPAEQRSAREYRELAPSTAPAGTRKDW